MPAYRSRSFATKAVLLLFGAVVTGQTDAVWVGRLSESSGPTQPVGVRLDGDTATDTMS